MIPHVARARFAACCLAFAAVSLAQDVPDYGTAHLTDVQIPSAAQLERRDAETRRAANPRPVSRSDAGYTPPMPVEAADNPDFLFLAGDACLDFVNTRPIVKGRTADLLMTYEDFVRWLTRAGRMDARSAAEALKRWGEGPEGVMVIERARAFRETLRQMIDGLVRGRGVSTEGFAAINSILAENDGTLRLERQGGGFRTRFAASPTQPVALLGTIAEAAAELLTAKNPRLVRRCGNPDCVLFFYDATRNHRRQWCAMATCGNLMKVRAFRRRQRR